ncbi:STAS domain-containing protein [Streptomyces sp. NPDC003007]
MTVDLRPVEFLDCATLGLLCRARRRALDRGGHLALVCVHPWDLRILKAAGLSELFAPLATVQDALRAAAGGPGEQRVSGVEDP